jgi:hypothetical protein
MHWIDRLEKAARLVLWLTLASAVVLVPLAYINVRQAAEREREEATRRAEELARRATEPPKESRLLLSSTGLSMRALDEDTATGRVYFSNVSPRSGVVCVAGTATNPATNKATASLPACKAVSAYATNVVIEMMFAGGDLQSVCKGVSCAFSIKDVPDAAASPDVSAVAASTGPRP